MNIKKRFTASLLGLLMLAGAGTVILETNPANASTNVATVAGSCSGFGYVSSQYLPGRVGRVDVYWKGGSAQENCVELHKLKWYGQATYTSLDIRTNPAGQGGGAFADDTGPYLHFAGAAILTDPGCLYIYASMGPGKTMYHSVEYTNGPKQPAGSTNSYDTNLYGCKH